MKRIVAFLLLTAFFLNIIGYHFIFQIQQHQIKAEMKQQLRNAWKIQNATELRFSLSDRSALAQLKWEDEREFILNGEMYDIIEKNATDTELIIVCVKDKKENHLIKEFAKISSEKQGDPNSKNKSVVLLKLITGIFINNDQPVISLPISKNKKTATLLCDAISSGTKEILIPPPQSC